MQIGSITQLTPMYNNTLGFERIFDHLERAIVNTKSAADKYPPHNIIKKNENNYVVELAVAGFTKDEIDITVENSNLTIKGMHIEKDSDIEYLYRGIGTRSFTKTIKLADTIVVQGAEFKDGILTITLENIVPENKKPRKIEISYKESPKQLLTE